MQLGPDPNRSYLERHNQMFPSRYGMPGPFPTERKRKKSHASEGEGEGAGGSEVDIASDLRALSVLLTALPAGMFATFLLTKQIGPESLSVGWIFRYLGMFVVCTAGAGYVAYRLRRLLTIAWGLGVLAFVGWAGVAIIRVFR